MDDMEKVRLEYRSGIALLWIDNPPVNALSKTVIEQLGAAIDAFAADRTAEALVIASAGHTFIAGGDIAGFSDPHFSTAPLNRVLRKLEALDRPVVVSMHGTVLGGGLEVALACHWRIADRQSRFGMPEVSLGLLPGSLGTQRLPRLIGVRAALDLIASGKIIRSGQALDLGLLDQISDGDPVEEGIRCAQALLKSGARLRRTSEMTVNTDALDADFFDNARTAASKAQGFHPSAAAIVEAVEASLRPFQEGEAVEAKLFSELRASSQSKALRHLFFAQRQAQKIPGLSRDVSAIDIKQVGVLGGGTMGRGIAINFLNAGIPVVMVEMSAQSLEAAASGIRQVYEGLVAKGRLLPQEHDDRIALLQPTVNVEALAACDLVIEAVFEDLALKRTVCARLGALCKPGAIIATNTSTLDVDELAKASGRPGQFIGMHFFRPAHVMRLLEIVRGTATEPDVLLTVLQLARTISKVAVVSGVCWGFIGNRMLEPYLREAEFLLLEGATPSQIDAAMEQLGLAMGPCRMLDMAGIDVDAKVVIEASKAGVLPDDPSYRAVVRKLFELGRMGQKAGYGYYRYEGRKAIADPAIEEITAALAREYDIQRRDRIGQDEIVQRLLFPLINEGMRILEEGIAYRASDIDVVWVSGYGFPDHLGGPMFHAQSLGLSSLVQSMQSYAESRGNQYGYWTPSDLLVQLAASGSHLQDWKNAL